MTPPPALCSPGFQEAVLWQAQVAPPEADPSDRVLPSRADAVIIGGGYAGLAAGYELATRGHEVVVLERDQLGRGASTRNGGMVIPELKAGPAALTRQYGPVGAEMYREVNEAFDLVEKLIDDDEIDCHYERSGQLWLAHSARAVTAVRHFVDEHGDSLGEDVQFLDRDELGTEIGSTAFHAGARIGRTGGLQPAAFHAGLARRARRAGAEVHDRTAATDVTPQSGRRGVRVDTTNGAVEARVVLSCTNAYADNVVPRLRRRVLPVGSFVIATEVLDAQVAATLVPHRRMLVDTRNFLAYWRLSHDGRMVFGGRRSLAPTSLAEARDYLYGEMLRIHPQLSGVAIDYAWGGHVAITLDRMPHVGCIDGVWYATGCNGSGVALNTWMGTRLAQALCGDAPLPACSRIRHPAIPLDRVREAYLPLVGRYLQYQDHRR